MNLIVKKTLGLQGSATIPGSKSQSIRAILFALLARGESVLLNLLDSEDTQAALQVCASLGAEIKTRDDKFYIESNGVPLRSGATELHTDNSGITTLFTLPLLGLRENCTIPIILNCGEQMRARPIQSLVNALRQLGMIIKYVAGENKLPISVSGQLKGGEAEVDGINSQYLSALLISLPCGENDSVITVKNLHERPYVNMTLDFLNEQGIHYTHNKKDTVDIFLIRGNQQYTAFNHVISGDFSSASCLIAAAALLPGEVELQGLDFKDAQGDKKLVILLQKMGANIKVDNNKMHILGNKPLTGIRVDANDIPDLVPALAVIGTQALGKTEIYNVTQARIKETDRIHSMTEGLRKMGAVIEEYADGMTIYQSNLQGAFVSGCNDHRTVMALSIAGIIAEGTTTITNGDAINKTYPCFVETLQTIGANANFDKSKSNKHVVLIGFKHVGKTLIGHQLAKKINKNFIDLDKEIENLYKVKYSKFLSCRQIVQTHGEQYYRELESNTLKLILHSTPCVISLGGGTLLSEFNQEIIQEHILLHVDAPRGVVFERIMVEGRPAFFDPNKDPYESFSHLWDERNKIYKKLTQHTINNSSTIEQAVNQAIVHLNNQENSHYV
jgi:3-phosphoshikimate 1-carboxyvinyltransferase